MVGPPVYQYYNTGCIALCKWREKFDYFTLLLAFCKDCGVLDEWFEHVNCGFGHLIRDDDVVMIYLVLLVKREKSTDDAVEAKCW